MLPNRLLFYGPKGCDKTLFAKVFFGELGLTPLKLKKPEILKNPFDNLKEAFDLTDRLGLKGIIIEDFNDFLIDLYKFKSARRYLIL